MTTFKDLDLREALRRQYANAPTLPADFMDHGGGSSDLFSN
jgi:hypothetical protein